MPPKIAPDAPQSADDFFLSLSRCGLQIDPAGDWLWLPHPDKAKAKKGLEIVAMPVRRIEK